MALFQDVPGFRGRITFIAGRQALYASDWIRLFVRRLQQVKQLKTRSVKGSLSSSVHAQLGVPGRARTDKEANAASVAAAVEAAEGQILEAPDCA